MSEADRPEPNDISGAVPVPPIDWAAPDTGPAQPSTARVDSMSTPTASGRAPGTAADRVVPPVRMRPTTVTEILDGSFAVIRTRPRTVLVIAAAILVPVQMLSAYASRSGLAGMGAMFGQRSLTVLNDSTPPTITTSDFLLSITAMLMGSLAVFFLGAALTHLVTQWYVGGDPSAGESLRVAFRRGWSIVAAWGVLLVVKFAAAIPCYLGLVFVIPLFSLTAPVMIAEGTGPIASAKRSWQLVSRRLWRNIGVVALVVVVEYVLHQALALLPTALAVALPSPFDWITLGVTTSLVSLLTTSALVSASVLLYLDMRIRTEGLDLEIDAVDAF